MTADAAELGAALPDYVIGELLGRGQFGLVWAARHRRLDRAAAVKLLTGGAVADPRNAERFRREARLLAQIDHGHVVRVHDFRETGGRSLLIMERLTGGTLADRLHTGMNAESILVAVVAAASGLHHLHRQGVLHRDVKPANLMFDAAGVLKVTDFGTARGQDLLRGVTDIVGPVAPGTDVHRAVTVNIGDLTGLDCTSPGEFIGTPGFTSPEQAAIALGLAAAPVGAAADQYALGVVLYQALSGCYPHAVDGGVAAVLARRAGQPARSVTDANPAVPPPFRPVIMRALERRPEDRYPSVEDFALAVCAAATATWGPTWASRSTVDLAEPGPLWTAVHAPAAPVGVPPLGAAPGPRRRPRRWRPWAAVAAIVLAGAAATTVILIRTADPPVDGAATGGATAAPVVPELLTDWRFPTGGQVFATPAIVGDVVVIGGLDGSIYGIDRVGGDRRWTVPTDGAVRSSAASSADLAIVGSDDGQVRAIRVGDGTVEWTIPINVTIVGGPAVTADSVYVAADRLYAFAADTRQQRWAADIGGSSSSTPVVAGDRVIVGSNDGHVYGFSVADGAESWRVSTGGPVLAPPVVADGVVYVGSRGRVVVALDAATGTVHWRTQVGAPVHGAVAVAQDRVFLGTTTGTVLALRRDDGSPWSRWTTVGRVDAAPALVGGAGVVIGTNDGRIVQLDRDLLRVLGEYRTGGPVLSSPLVVDGAIYVGSYDGSVYRLQVAVD